MCNIVKERENKEWESVDRENKNETKSITIVLKVLNFASHIVMLQNSVVHNTLKGAK